MERARFRGLWRVSGLAVTMGTWPLTRPTWNTLWEPPEETSYSNAMDMQQRSTCWSMNIISKSSFATISHILYQDYYFFFKEYIYVLKLVFIFFMMHAKKLVCSFYRNIVNNPLCLMSSQMFGIHFISKNLLKGKWCHFTFRSQTFPLFSSYAVAVMCMDLEEVKTNLYKMTIYTS